ncbi:MAG: hypothetical protein CMH53_07790 [Myxococcales bacterium]|nr:hypothetical protein [Myxococcales bacterium]
MSSRLGDFVVEHQYAVNVNDMETLLERLSHVRQWLTDLGVANYELWQDSDNSGRINEVIAYDSWSHYMRLSQKPLPPKLKEVYDDLSRLIEGGFDKVVTQKWEPIPLSN